MMRQYRARLQIANRILKYKFEAENPTAANRRANGIRRRTAERMNVSMEEVFLSYFDDTPYFMARKLGA